MLRGLPGRLSLLCVVDRMVSQLRHRCHSGWENSGPGKALGGRGPEPWRMRWQACGEVLPVSGSPGSAGGTFLPPTHSSTRRLRAWPSAERTCLASLWAPACTSPRTRGVFVLPDQRLSLARPHLAVLILAHLSLSSSSEPLCCGPQNVLGSDLGKWVSGDITKTREEE